MIDQIKAKYQRRRDFIVLALKGFCMGMADVIPGISGGTIAFLLGIYEDLIGSIKSFDLRFLKLLCRFKAKEAFSSVAWQFLVSLFIGIAGAIFIFSKMISWLLHNEPALIYSFFFGLILATVPIIARIIKRWTFSKVIAIFLSACGTYFFVGMVPLTTPEAPWFLFLSGAVAISAMILPGISGAFILVLLGKYQFILNAVNQQDIFSLGVFLLGVGVGIFSFVRVLSWLFEKYHDLTVTVITGIIIGSLRKIWPWKEVTESITTSHGKIIPIAEMNIIPAQFNADLLAALMIMVAGFMVAMMLNSSSDGKLLS
jgi:putative membrane protein